MKRRPDPICRNNIIGRSDKKYCSTTSIIKTNFIDTSTIMVGWNFHRKNCCLFVNNPIAYPAAKIPEQVKNGKAIFKLY